MAVELNVNFVERAAQLWCLPQHGAKEMDVDFAESIATELKKVAVETFRTCARSQRENGFNDPETRVNQRAQALRWAEIYDGLAAELERP